MNKKVLPVRQKISVAPTDIRVAAYARVSTDEDNQISSLEAQKDFYEKKIHDHPGWTLVKVFADEGITGTSTKRREAFKEMIEACEDGKIDMIITKSISRFARNTVDTINVIRQLKALGIRLPKTED